jgi:hypothetical protein
MVTHHKPRSNKVEICDRERGGAARDHPAVAAVLGLVLLGAGFLSGEPLKIAKPAVDAGESFLVT